MAAFLRTTIGRVVGLGLTGSVLCSTTSAAYAEESPPRLTDELVNVQMQNPAFVSDGTPVGCYATGQHTELMVEVMAQIQPEKAEVTFGLGDGQGHTKFVDLTPGGAVAERFDVEQAGSYQLQATGQDTGSSSVLIISLLECDQMTAETVTVTAEPEIVTEVATETVTADPVTVTHTLEPEVVTHTLDTEVVTEVATETVTVSAEPTPAAASSLDQQIAASDSTIDHEVPGFLFWAMVGLMTALLVTTYFITRMSNRDKGFRRGYHAARAEAYVPADQPGSYTNYRHDYDDVVERDDDFPPDTRSLR